MKLDDRQIELYSRQIILRELGGVGQQKLLAARCLALGDGSDLETAAAYLSGAGIGGLDLIVGEGDEERGESLLSAAAGLDTLVRILPPDATVELETYDVVLVATAGAGARSLGARAVGPAARARGRPRLGSIAIIEDSSGGLALLLAPTAAEACLACIGLGDSAEIAPARSSLDADGASRDDALAMPLAGAMAALAALRWLADIARDERPRALRLAPHAATWVEGAIARELSCPRGCRPRT